jgi:enoyl-CoA hydratase/carnithine racemase
VILTGAAGHFTAGNDLREFQAERGSGDSAAMTFLRALVRADVPIVAAVGGYAIGIGVTLIQHCDFAYATDNATLRMPFIALGLCPEGASSLLMPRLVGARKASEWLMSGRTITAAKACEAGLLNAVIPTGDALAAAYATAADLASQPPAALRLTKSLLKRRDRALIEDVLDDEAQHFNERLKTDEA